jgi:hypothetical protein
MSTQPLFVIVNSFPVTQGQEPIVITPPLPYEEATSLCWSLNLWSSPVEFFETCEA